MDTAAARFRALLAKKELIVAPGAFDPYTARIIESLGFPAVYLGGNAIGTQLCVGEPLTTLTETVECAARVQRAISVPLVVDADAGFGDATHSFRTVQEFERAGVAAIHIEDQPFPKRAHYHRGQGRVTDLQEVLEKLQAAREARRDPDFCIIGRTDALRVTGSMDETLRRCHAYIEAGVDMLMPMRPTPEEGAVLRRELPDVPLIWLSGIGESEISTSQVADLGYQLLIYPVIAPIVITEAIIAVYSKVRDTGSTGLSQASVVAMRQKILELIGMPKYWAIEERTTERV
jgi:methylisocitrate lyase